MSHNRGAIALYERTGFTVEGVKHGAICIDNLPVDECVMGKLLSR